MICFSVPRVKASDSADKKQLPFHQIYIDKNGDIFKDFIKSIYFQFALTGKDLYNKVNIVLESFNLVHLKFLRSSLWCWWCMSDKLSGFSALFLKHNLKDLCIHCASHMLNLAIISSCEVVNLRTLMNSVKRFFQIFAN